MTTPTRHLPWARILFACWHLIVTALAIVAVCDNARLARAVASTASTTQTQALEGRVIALQEQFASGRRQPAPLSQAAFANAREALETRLTALERSADDAVHGGDMQAIRAALEKLQTEVDALRKRDSEKAPAPRPAKRSSPKVPAAPFQILGLESRGGERFLSIAPTGSVSLDQARLLRPGEADDDWRLESLEPHRATFQVRGVKRELVIP